MNIVVATHNLMHAMRLPALIRHYLALRDRRGLDLLCLQENRFLTEETDLPSDRIAAALGPDYRVVRDDGCPGLAFVHDSRTLACEPPAIVPLPRLAGLTPFERLYIRGGKTKQKYVLLAELRPRGGRARVRGGLLPPRHRGRQQPTARTQVEAIAAALRARDLQGAFVACGDSNAFAWRRQPEALQRLFAPLAAFGAVRSRNRGRRTGSPARTRASCFTRRACCWASSGSTSRSATTWSAPTSPVAERGQVDTPDSDHDLVWARVDLRAERH